MPERRTEGTRWSSVLEMTDPGRPAARNALPVGFVIAGVQKAGTTTLYGALRRHPQVARSKLKELHYFDNDARDWEHPDHASYERGIASNESALISGEASPSYLFWPGALVRMHAYNPRMRLILSFRDPIERAFSQWCMNKGRDASHPEFSAAIRAYAPTSLPAGLDEAGGRDLSYVARGYYGAQLSRALELFDREQMLYLEFSTAFASFTATVDQMTDFLEVQRYDTHPERKRNRAQPGNLIAPPPTADDISMLADLFAEDLADFARLSDVDVSGWPTMAVAMSRAQPGDLAAALAAKAGLSGA